MTTKIDLDKARSTLHQLYRDWSAEGAVERGACYGPVVEDLVQRFGSVLSSSSAAAAPTMRSSAETADIVNHNTPPSPPNILVPGAGLGRLVFDLARLGFAAEGNELSYHQLFTSSYILNHTTSANQHSLYPFAHTFSNHLSRADQLLRVSIPDVHPGSCQPLKGSMSMTTGDFTSVYAQDEYESRFDAVATVFFVDTTPNLLAYVETMKRCLRRGGWWINVGPLLWHFGEKEKEREKDDDGNDDDGDDDGQGKQKEQKTDMELDNKQTKIGSTGGSVQLTDQEVVKIVEASGFEIELHETGKLSTGYVQNSKSMLLNTYRPSHWVARKL